MDFSNGHTIFLILPLNFFHQCKKLSIDLELLYFPTFYVKYSRCKIWTE